MKTYAFRLTTGADLKLELERLSKENELRAGVVLACVGSFSRAKLRMAGAKPGQEDIREYQGEVEVVSVEGVISSSGMHVHLSITDKEGKCVGGHLKEGCIVHTTMEVVIGENDQYVFDRESDPKTGFTELEIKSR